MHVEKNKNKSGKVISFRVTVYGGKDSNGHETRHKKTFKIPKDMPASKIPRYIREVSAKYENDCMENSTTYEFTFEEYAAIAMEAKRLAGVKKTTLARYDDMLVRINECIGSYKLADLKPYILEDFYRLLEQPGQNTKTGTGLAAKTIKEHHGLISSILEHAVNNDILSKNVARKATVPKVAKKEAPHFEPEELAIILQCAEKEPIKWHTLIKMFAFLGGRRGEIVGLKWQAINMRTRLISLQQNTLYLPSEGIYDDTLKTDASVRYLPFPEEIEMLLKSYKEWQDTEIQKRGDLYVNRGYVFTQFNGKPIHPDSINGYLRKFEKKYDLPHIYPHKFRHTASSILISSGLDLVTVSRYIGHSNPSTTAAIYAHPIAKKQAEASKALGDILLQKVEPE